MRTLRFALSVIVSAAVLAGPASGSDGATRSFQTTSTSLSAPGGGWWRTVQRNIRQAEYAITWQDHTYVKAIPAAYQAPNRAQNLRTYFTADGIRSIPRTWSGQAPEWEWGLTVVGIGSPGATQAPAPAALHVSGNRIEYRRGALTEWYVNDERGLEQGFTIAAPPGGPGASVRIQIDLAVLGTLVPDLGSDGRTITWATGGGEQVLQYGSLAAADVTGRTLPARMTVGPPRTTIHLILDAAGAAFPITIDPVVSAVAGTPIWTAESDQNYAELGAAVATAGDVNGDGFSDVIVGAFLYDAGQTDEGRVYVYHGSANGPGLASAWSAEGNQVNARFGWSVGTAGDVNGDGFSDVIVGAHLYDNVQSDEGRAFVYHGSASGLSLGAAWTAESNQISAQFGWAVGTAGDVNGDGFSDVVVGAWAYDNGQSNEGRAFVYHGSASGLNVSAPWTAESNQASSSFGLSVGTAGDVNGDGYSDVIVGAPSYNNGQSGEGRVFVYQGSAIGLGLSSAWTAESNQSSASFGHAVATAGDVNGDGYADVLVGAPNYDNGQPDEGRTFAYYGSNGGLGLAAMWSAESNQAAARFGNSVSTAGDVNGDGYADVLVGADGYDGFHTNEGRVSVFQGSALGLVGMLPAWSAEGNQTSAQFGVAVATAGDVNGDGFSDVLIGAFGYDNGQVNEGRAFLFLGTPDSPSASWSWFADGDQSSAALGQAVATAGDVNGDGYADVIVGAYLYDNGQGNEGRAFVYHGSGGGLNISPAWTVESNQAGAWFGVSVGTAGDVNGDGYADVIVGALGYDNGQVDEGSAFVYHGSSSGLSTTPARVLESNQLFASFGRSVGTAGDVNGDGFADVIVGAYLYDSGQSNEGRAFVYHGSAGGLSASAAWTAESNQASAFFGRSVGTAGDVNRDGFSDVIVGAYAYDSGNTDEGQAFVYFGSPGGLSMNFAWTAGGNQDFAQFGTVVAAAGDVNGDGYADVVIGAPSYDNGQVNEGRAYVYYGHSTGLGTKTPKTVEGNQTSAAFGSSAATAGDVNGDGYADVIVGAPLYDNGQTNEGQAFVFHGSSAGLVGSPAWSAEGGQTSASFGGAVASAGDVNGDGFADIVVGAEQYDNGQLDEGVAFVYYGGGGPGVRHRPRQLRISGGPIAHLGKSDSSSGFLLAVRGRTPFGRGRVKMQVEVKPLGVAFDGTGLLQTANWQETGVNGVNMSRTLGGLLPMTAYHWRIRILYHPARSPFQQRGRWLMMPWNGWNEKDLRTF